MNDPVGMRMGAIVMTIGMLPLFLLGYRFGTYSQIRDKAKHREGRGYSTNLQSGILGWMVAVLFAYVVMPQFAVGLRGESQGLIDFFFGWSFLAFSVCVWYTHRLLPQDKWRYQYMLAGGVLAAAMGLLSQAIPWILYLPASPALRTLGLAGSLALFATCELLFLAKNKWKFRPTHPG